MLFSRWTQGGGGSKMTPVLSHAEMENEAGPERDVNFHHHEGDTDNTKDDCKDNKLRSLFSS